MHQVRTAVPEEIVQAIRRLIPDIGFTKVEMAEEEGELSLLLKVYFYLDDRVGDDEVTWEKVKPVEDLIEKKLANDRVVITRFIQENEKFAEDDAV